MTKSVAPLPKKRADKPAQYNWKTPHDQHAQPPLNPRGRAQSPMPGTGLQPQPGKSSQAVKQTPRCTTPPKGETPTQQAKGCHRKATAYAAKRPHSPLRRRTANIQAS
ncbi:hypothetical protein CRENBAI_000611 [Crenichthys baileyi]|uniref:Uncharacterized protein n=1 Tax=Crenichthys baileyi TaxID=28760 RepID=A0AAV9RZH9_9TELE